MPGTPESRGAVTWPVPHWPGAVQAVPGNPSSGQDRDGQDPTGPGQTVRHRNTPPIRTRPFPALSVALTVMLLKELDTIPKRAYF